MYERVMPIEAERSTFYNREGGRGGEKKEFAGSKVKRSWSSSILASAAELG